VIWVAPWQFPAVKQLAEMNPEKRSKFRQWAFMIAIFVACTLVAENAALFYSPIGFLQVLKECGIPLVYALSVAVGLDTLSPIRIPLVILIPIGGWMCVHGEVDFVLGGFLLQCFSVTCKALQVVSQGSILKGSDDLNLDPISYTAYICPACLLVLTPIAVYEVFRSSLAVVLLAFRSYPLILLLSCCLAMGTNLLVAAVIKSWDPVCFVCLGSLKNVVILSSSVIVLGETWVACQFIGCAIIFVSVPTYAWTQQLDKWSAQSTQSDPLEVVSR
jgi:drug/metabolite transporter (DMT)-like permease